MFANRMHLWSRRTSMRVPMKKLVPTSGIQRIFTSFFPETSSSTGFSFPEFFLFDTFIKLGFYTFIIPFRFAKSRREGRLKMKTNPFQLIISTIIVLGAAIYSFFSIRLLFNMNLKNNPSEAFAVIYGMMRACFPTLWFYAFWFRRNSFNKLLMVCQTASSPSVYLVSCLSTPVLGNMGMANMGIGNPGMANNMGNATPGNYEAEDEDDPDNKRSVDWKIALVTKLCVLIAFGKIAYEAYQYYKNFGNIDEFLDAVLGFNGGSALFNIFQKSELTLRNLTRTDIFQQWNQTALTFSVLVIGGIHDYIINSVDSFCCIGAAVMFSVCRRFSLLIPKLGDNSSIDYKVLEKDREESVKFLKLLEKLSVNYVEIGNVMDATNEIYGPIFLLYILAAFPSLAGFMVFKQQSLVTGEKFGWSAMIYLVAMHVIITMTASEAASRMVDYKCWLFDVSLLRNKPTVWKTGLGSYQKPLPLLSNAVLSRINHLHREVASDSVGLKGCGFFTMTHGVIGTMLGIFVTFAIVIVQFEMDVAQKKT